MNPLPRTLAFVVAAVLSVGAAGLTYYSSRPAKVTWDTEIGKEFFPDFQDPNSATSLQVATFDKEASKTNTFSVEFKDGKWRIPSHNNYPADGKDRLKQTAASVIGIKRGTLAGTNKEAHKQHNLLDPLDQSINETEGRGDRITLKNGEKVLVDYIIGKKKEGPGNIYYIRKADEPSFFLSEVKIELSTKFGDWIEPDLLGLKRDDVKEIFLDRYSVNEAEGVVVQGEKSVLNRDNATADWKIDGIDATAVKPKTSVISAMLGSLDDLKITGVRKKPEGLSASLQGDESIKLTQSTLLDLQNHGYFYIPKKGIVSNEGDMLVSTFDGVSYVLRFGEVIEGSDVEIEVGSPNESTKKPAAEGEKKEGDKPADEAKKDAGDEGADKASKKNRFVFIMAQHDPKLLGEPPVEPVKPEPPQEAAPAEAKPAAEGEKKEDEKAAEPVAPTPEAQAAADAKAAYETAMMKYQTDSDVYRIKKKEYDEKLAAGEKRAKELNARFADWYYVISEDLFDELRVKSEDLVEPLPPPEKLPETPLLPSTPAAEPAKEPAPEGDTPAAEKPAEKPAEEKPAEGDKPAEPAAPAEGDKPAEPAKPEADKPAEPPATEPEKPAEPKAE